MSPSTLFVVIILTLLFAGWGRATLLLLLIALFIVQNVVVGELDILYIFLANINAEGIFDYFFGFKNCLGALSLLVLLPVAK